MDVKCFFGKAGGAAPAFRPPKVCVSCSKNPPLVHTAFRRCLGWNPCGALRGLSRRSLCKDMERMCCVGEAWRACCAPIYPTGRQVVVAEGRRAGGVTANTTAQLNTQQDGFSKFLKAMGKKDVFVHQANQKAIQAFSALARTMPPTWRKRTPISFQDGPAGAGGGPLAKPGVQAELVEEPLPCPSRGRCFPPGPVPPLRFLEGIAKTRRCIEHLVRGLGNHGHTDRAASAPSGSSWPPTSPSSTPMGDTF